MLIPNTDKRNECVIDFYRLIDTIDIKQIRLTNFYRLTTPGTRVQSRVVLSTSFQLSEENKLNYANVYRNTVKDADSQTYSLTDFFLREGGRGVCTRWAETQKSLNHARI